ncbi:hypothetical protein C8R47DRAFT_1161484 [Mycena vitilis]|nr:hypothetical protein C8R47DRAFT_1161484 [Mycena vitilis]
MADFVVPGSPAARALLAVKKKRATRKKKPPDVPPPADAPVTGTVDEATGFVNLPVAPRSGKGSRRRDFTAQIKQHFATADAMVAATEAFDKLHLKPIAISTQANHDSAQRLWTEWFTLLYKSPALAAATLVADAPSEHEALRGINVQMVVD